MTQSEVAMAMHKLLDRAERTGRRLTESENKEYDRLMALLLVKPLDKYYYYELSDNTIPGWLYCSGHIKEYGIQITMEEYGRDDIYDVRMAFKIERDQALFYRDMLD